MKNIIFALILGLSLNAHSQEEEKSNFSSLRVETNFSTVEIGAVDSNQGKLKLLSKNNLGVGLSLAENWNKDNTSFIKFQYNKLDFNSLQNLNIENLSQSLTWLSVGHTYTFTDSFRVSGSLIMGEELYVRAKDIGVLTVDKFSNFLIKTDAELDFVNKKNFSLGGQVSLEGSAPFSAEAYGATEGTGNYEVKTALAYGGALYGRKYLDGYSLEGSLFFKLKNASTTITEQSVSTQGISLRLAIPFGY